MNGVVLLSTDSSPAGVELRGLVKSFGSGDSIVRAVQGIDVSIAPGETVALLGPNGAGKSTTIDMLLGLTAPDAGSVSLFGQPPARRSPAGAVGAMLQTGGLIRDLTVRELVAMVASLYPAPLDVDEVLELAGIDELAEQRTQKLSGGQTQRRAVRARARQRPRPARAGRADRRHGCRGAPRVLARRCAGSPPRARRSLFATHYLEEADAYADRVVLMARGRIVADGPTTEIKAMAGVRTIRATAARRRRRGVDRPRPASRGVERHGDRP